MKKTIKWFKNFLFWHAFGKQRTFNEGWNYGANMAIMKLEELFNEVDISDTPFAGEWNSAIAKSIKIIKQLQKKA